MLPQQCQQRCLRIEGGDASSFVRVRNAINSNNQSNKCVVVCV